MAISNATHFEEVRRIREKPVQTLDEQIFLRLTSEFERTFHVYLELDETLTSMMIDDNPDEYFDVVDQLELMNIELDGLNHLIIGLSNWLRGLEFIHKDAETIPSDIALNFTRLSNYFNSYSFVGTHVEILKAKNREKVYETVVKRFELGPVIERINNSLSGHKPLFSTVNGLNYFSRVISATLAEIKDGVPVETALGKIDFISMDYLTTKPITVREDVNKFIEWGREDLAVRFNRELDELLSLLAAANTQEA